MAPFVWELRVRYGECDMQGHAFNAHYLAWADVAHTEMLRAAIGPYQELVAAGVDLVVAEANVRFRAGARFDDLLAIEVAVESLGETSMVTRFAMRRDGEPVAELEVRHVCVDARTHRKRPWPERVRAGVARFAPAPAS